MEAHAWCRLWRASSDIKRGKVSVRTSVTVGVASSISSERRHSENDVTMRTGAASAVGARRHNENDVTTTIAGCYTNTCHLRHQPHRTTTCDPGYTIDNCPTIPVISQTATYSSASCIMKFINSQTSAFYVTSV